MNNFNDRVFLLLTLKKSEVREYYFQTIAVLLAIGCYNLIGVFIKTPIIISYPSLIVAFLIITFMFVLLSMHSLDIDWELLDYVEQQASARPSKKETSEPKVVEQEKVEEEESVSSNRSILMDDDEDEEFDFADNLMDLYNTGTPQQLADVAVNGVERKVRRIQNLQTPK